MGKYSKIHLCRKTIVITAISTQGQFKEKFCNPTITMQDVYTRRIDLPQSAIDYFLSDDIEQQSYQMQISPTRMKELASVLCQFPMLKTMIVGVRKTLL